MILKARAFTEYMLAFALLLFAWWYASGPMALPQYLLPTPGSVASTLWSMMLEGELHLHLYFTIQNILIGLFFGTIFGVMVAYLFFKVPKLGSGLESTLVILQTAPKIALAPLVIIWFGLGVAAKVILIFSLVFFPVFAGALAGFRSIDSRMHDIARLLSLRTTPRFFQIDLPAALPGIFVGIKIAAVQALVGAILSEWLSGDLGLGYLMTLAAATYKTSILFGAVLLTSLIGILMHSILNHIESTLLSWSLPDGS